MNLLSNSFQALQGLDSRQDSVIAIQSRKVDGWVEIAISDNGPGVEPEMQESLFQILSTSKESGMGVGLWLSKYIIESFAGELSHAPPRLGGATFVIRLPAMTQESTLLG